MRGDGARGWLIGERERGAGRYIVAPPSLHADGQRCRWRTRQHPAALPAYEGKTTVAGLPCLIYGQGRET